MSNGEVKEGAKKKIQIMGVQIYFSFSQNMGVPVLDKDFAKNSLTGYPALDVLPMGVLT
jgi:hypothetical protein